MMPADRDWYTNDHMAPLKDLYKIRRNPVHITDDDKQNPLIGWVRDFFDPAGGFKQGENVTGQYRGNWEMYEGSSTQSFGD